jgi:hypothetical protein
MLVAILLKLLYLKSLIEGVFYSYFDHIVIVSPHVPNLWFYTAYLTCQYYLGMAQKGIFLVTVLRHNKVNRIAFKGDIQEIRGFVKVRNEVTCKRKNILFKNGSETSTIDMRILDEYYSNIGYFGARSVTKLQDIMEILGYECTHIYMFTMRPYSMLNVPITGKSIEFIY